MTQDMRISAYRDFSIDHSSHFKYGPQHMSHFFFYRVAVQGHYTIHIYLPLRKLTLPKALNSVVLNKLMLLPV